ncbi:MAG: beta-propeller domain-containing protein [Candidatus Bathyarchaeota archaeon]|nr:beta-propeller domain-containing protein [Candidatus Bathyarchaeum sp.]
MDNTKAFVACFIGIILVTSSIPIYVYLNDNPETLTPIELNQFTSYDELKTFLESTEKNSGYYFSRGNLLGLEDSFVEATVVPSAAPEPQDADYSETNVQVEGVDEADIVKTDGEYIYIVSGETVTIMKAFPPEEAQVVSKIVLEGGITGIFINGDKLAVFETEYGVYPLYEKDLPVPIVDSEVVTNSTADDEESVKPTEPSNQTTPSGEPDKPVDGLIEPVEPFVPIIYEPPTTTVKVYDVSNKANPVLTREFSVDGNYFSSRMIGDYVYMVATQYTYLYETDVFLPRVHYNNQTETIEATEIYFYNNSDTSYTFTTLVAVNIQNDAQEPTYETVLLGGTSGLYVSTGSIYMTFPEYNWQEDEGTKTKIYKAKIDQEKITFIAEGEVPGYVLNQFSMDEYNGYFRVATTVNNNNWRTFAAENEPSTKNNVYVLDSNLNVVGSLEDLAPGEQIYSARFMGNRAYVVTFRNVDPLFVIDLSLPTAPTVLGQLKVTGYSGYLHPYDENHIIGIGKETDYDSEEDFAWYQGVKISMFDVSDVSNPREVAKYEIGDRGTNSPILSDHKSLLFDKEKNLLVIPVLVAELDENDYEGEIPDWTYGEFVWQGAYVFDISPAGINLRGQITHMDDNTDLLKSGYRFYSGYSVQRSLYIENVLYTISNMKVKMNALDTLTELNSVEIA